MNGNIEMIENIENTIVTMAEQNGNVEVDQYDLEGTTIVLTIKTLTAVIEPEINYYEDGYNDIDEFVEEVKKVYPEYKVEFQEDLNICENEWDCWVAWNGFIKVTL